MCRVLNRTDEGPTATTGSSGSSGSGGSIGSILRQVLSVSAPHRDCVGTLVMNIYVKDKEENLQFLF